MGIFFDARETNDILAAGVQRAVQRSLATRPMIVLTRAEVQRRIELAGKVATELAYEKGWPADKVVDKLTEALESLLDGKDYKPDDRATWLTDDPGANEGGSDAGNT